MKTYNERVAHAQATIASALEYTIKHLESFIVALNQVGRKGSVKNPSYTKKGPGRYHQVRTKREIREEQELKAKKLQQRLEAENLVNHAQA